MDLEEIKMEIAQCRFNPLFSLFLSMVLCELLTTCSAQIHPLSLLRFYHAFS